MKPVLIGVLLNSLQDQYRQGACDDLSTEEQDSLLKDITKISDYMQDKQDKVLTIEETSQYLRVSRQTVNHYVKEGKLKPTKHLGGVMEFKLKDLKRFVKESKETL